VRIRINCPTQSQRNLIGIFVLLFAVSAHGPVLGDDASPSLSTNPVIRKLEDDTLCKLKKSKPEAQSDALLHLGKFCFENHDVERAQKYMQQALNVEEHLSRPGNRVDLLRNMAHIYAVQGKLTEAEANLKGALGIATSAGFRDSITSTTNDLGVLCMQEGHLDEADQYLKKAFELGQADKDVATMMHALINQAGVARKRKNIKMALEILNQALALSEKGELDSSVGHALENLARVQHDLGNLDASVAAYKRAIDFFKQDVDIENQANACWGLAETYYDLQRIPSACEYYQQGLDVLRNEPDDELKIKMMIGLGSAEADLGHFELAQKIHTKAYELSAAIQIRSKELESILQLGNDLLLNGYPEAGLYRLLEGEKLVERGGLEATQKGAYLMAIGRCYKTLGQSESAQKYYEEALRLFTDLSDNTRRALALNSLAVLALDNQNKDEFDRCYQAAKSIYADCDDKRDLAILDYNYAQYTLIGGKVQDAAILYAQALENVKGSGDQVAESMILRGLGLAQLASGHPQQSISFYDRALALADQSGAIEAQWDSHLGLGKCYKRLGLNDMALSHLTKSVDLVEKERGQLTRDSFKTYNLDLRNDCFVELVDLYIRVNRPYDALATAEKGRARAFLDMLSSRKHGRTVENFQAPLSGQAHPQTSEVPQMVAMIPSEPGSRGVSVIPRASQINSSTAISPVNASAPDIAEMKELVRRSNSTLVEYYLLPDKLVVWVIDPDSTIHMLPPVLVSKQQLSEKVALTYETITHQPKNQVEVASLGRRRQDMLRELHDLLIKPIEPYLPKDEQSLVTIIPHGPMFMIPFAALVSEDKKFFVEKHTLAYTPAIGVMRATQKLAQSFASQPDRLLAFGNPITKRISFLGALPYSEKEVQNIAALFGPANAVVKIGQEANKQSFEEMAPQFSEIHLATHGLVDEEHPMQSSLILAPTANDDGLLTVKDILAMKELKAKLVVLSACQTGRGKITGDGVVGLSRAFIIAGTPSVVVSQWNVDDVITEFQMKSFYKSYLNHSGRCRALRQAQLDTIKFMEGGNSGKGTTELRANPRYWAAFQLIGDCS
jgi:CHAT domain-containing protein/tetratricopeptide (TPR) repeat protein